MASILQELAAAAKVRAEAAKHDIPLSQMKELAGQAPQPPSFHDALTQSGMSFICECKKASPSKGLIAPEYDYVRIARDYEAAGASAISVLTEPTRFLGEDAHMREVSACVGIPVLRKDFVVDEYMIYQAKAYGASAVLLICTLLDAESLVRFLGVCDEVGIDALVEAHDEDEVRRAVASGARNIGVNNRNLADFTVDFGNAVNLRKLVPPDVAFVAESGVKTAGDIALLAESDVQAVLIGETLMRASDKRAALNELRGMAQ